MLTAAHCLTESDKETPRFWVLAGTTDLRVGGDVRKAIKVIPHPDYVKGQKPHDIALIRLEPKEGGATERSRRMQMLSIDGDERSRTNTAQAATQKVTVSGFGATREGQRGGSVRLMMAEIDQVSNEVCNGPAVYDGRITDGMMCAGQLQPNDDGKIIDACQGDSAVVRWCAGCEPNAR